MAPEALTADRLHREIKTLIMRGRFAPGMPVALQAMADAFGTSISPVRDALNRLVGERMIETQGGGGFVMPAITYRRAYYLYALHADQVRMVIKAVEEPANIGLPPASLLDNSPDPHSIVAATAELFSSLASCSPNPEHLDTIVGTGERLAVLRLHEGEVTRRSEELLALWNVTHSGNKNATRTAMGQYHRRRLLRADKISAAAARWMPDNEMPEGL
ncbi:GntR family transcriptional regulator [Sphingobium sp. CFD-2]|uniref:GntR family transcriptional regulator n=1 Tax=Sphingobium sp. CFD-2 TaxID=2878542 RepID=UPI00214C19DA|nr:GntR family transcriptional regulator [Sphingobium sp. CFD-2]